MIINVIVPHLAASIILKRYAPGLIIGLFLVIIIYKSVNIGAINTKEFAASTVIVSMILLLVLPVF